MTTIINKNKKMKYIILSISFMLAHSTYSQDMGNCIPSLPSHIKIESLHVLKENPLVKIYLNNEKTAGRFVYDKNELLFWLQCFQWNIETISYSKNDLIAALSDSNSLLVKTLHAIEPIAIQYNDTVLSAPGMTRSCFSIKECGGVNSDQ